MEGDVVSNIKSVLNAWITKLPDLSNFIKALHYSTISNSQKNRWIIAQEVKPFASWSRPADSKLHAQESPFKIGAVTNAQISY